MTRTLKSHTIMQLDLKPLGLGISEPLKQSGSSRSQMLFKVCSLRSFHRKHLCWNLLLKTLRAWRLATLLKRDPNTDLFLQKFLRADFFIEHLRWLLLTVLRQHGKVSWGFCSLILPFHVFYLNAKLLYK